MAALAEIALAPTLAPPPGRAVSAWAPTEEPAAADRRAPPRDRIELSAEARARLAADAPADPAPTDDPEATERANDPDGLNAEERQIVREMAQRDREVRDHEQAHAIAGGPYTGAPRYQMERGPDGRMYAVAGEVDIDVTPETEPEATIRKMEIVKRAALAPAQPSPEDRAVAATADQIRLQAQQELQRQRLEEQRDAGRADDDPLSADPTDPASDRTDTDARTMQAIGAYNAAASLIGALAG